MLGPSFNQTNLMTRQLFDKLQSELIWKHGFRGQRKEPIHYAMGNLKEEQTIIHEESKTYLRKISLSLRV